MNFNINQLGTPVLKKMILVVLLFTTHASNAGEIIDTKITSLMFDKQYSHQVYIKTSKQHDSGSKADCQNSVWSFVLKLDSEQAKSMYSMLLAAHMAGKSVTLAGTGRCDAHRSHTIEDLRRVELVSGM
ncbi:hypothetical protein NB501_16815 [Vibrio alginolyticus]|uniref:hypothetical protein n=1 Tax=Vibrio alginolyticus TaxID=663 RepID=UPI00215C0F70|nr:hypothetical protein [Vibrio alginolyticus]MCR9577116.1 hypothetical protein [Vibrio alginolyticus]